MWYREGTITFTQGSNTLVGAGTAWNVTANGVLPGMIVIGPDNKLYEIKRVISDTNIVLSEPYTGETQSEVPCRIITTYEGDLTQFSARFTALMSRMSADSKSIRSWLTALDEVTIEREDGTEVTVKPLMQIVNEHNENVEWYKNNTDAIDAAGDKAREAAASAAAAAKSANVAGEKASQASQSASAAASSQSAASASATAAKKSETNAAASQKSAATSASTATTKASEAATSARDAAASKEAAKSSETSAASSAGSAASSATAAGNSAKAAKTSETNADNSAQAAADSQTASANSATAAKKSETNAKNSEAAAKVSETNAKASENKAKEYLDKVGGLVSPMTQYDWPVVTGNESFYIKIAKLSDPGSNNCHVTLMVTNGGDYGSPYGNIDFIEISARGLPSSLTADNVSRYLSIRRLGPTGLINSMQMRYGLVKGDGFIEVWAFQRAFINGAKVAVLAQTARTELYIPDGFVKQTAAPSGYVEGNVVRIYDQVNKPSKSDVGLGNVTNDAQVKKTGDTMTGGLTFANDSILAWIRNTDWAKIGFKNDADGDTDSYMWFETGDNGNEYFKWRSRQSTTTKDLMNLKWDALSVLVKALFSSEVKISTVNALRIFNSSFGAIFRRSEESLYIIPTRENEGENGDIGPLRPFNINLRTGVVSVGHGLNVTGGVNGSLNGNASTATKLQTARTINGVSFDGSKNIELTPRSIGTINSATMSFSGGAGWFKLATVTMPQASSVVYISLIGGAGYNVGAPQQAGISELVLRAGNGNPKGITGALWRRTSVGFTNFAWVNTSGDTYDVYVEIGNYATGVNIQWDYTSNASVTIHTSPTYTANKPTGLTDGTVYVIYSSHIKPTATDVGALPITGGNLNGGLTATGEIISKSANGLRIAYGNYGFFIRNDGGSTYFMLTASGDTLGSWNGLRPITINNTSGAVSIGNGLNVTGGVNGSLNGNASTATKLQTARNINGVKFDGSGDININTLVSRGRVTALSGSTQGTAGIQMYEAYNNSYPTTYGNVLHMKGASAAGESELLIGWSGTSGAHAPVFIRSRRDNTGAAWSAWAQVYTAKDSIPGVNTTGNQNTTGNAATATKLQTARKIAGVAFDGSADITLTAANLNAYTKTEVANLLSSYASRSSLTGYSGNLDIVAETLVVKSGGSGGFAIWDIGTTTSGANMYIDPNPGINTVWRSTSSRRYKKDIETLQDRYADELLSLRPVWYRSICRGDRKNWGYYGLIAEEVGEIAPQYVHWREPTNNDSPEDISSNGMVAEGVMYERLVVPLIHHIQQLTKRVEELETKLNSPKE
ncbi:L-shaped tail fiber protein [Escherichia coli]|uniref:tail fiber domain-containing protein n=10 Tax=Escherichia coli TaxID=562 RepID=UPI0006A189C2|nr:tail fiber domain-containing protein [Escherichia coli]MDA6138707.1 tail fiber domain-containing protein [Escherichia coli]MDA6159076.1 tail fiber domain-containing protein [Escherichia coli]MDA6621446.1 tail fiber domain-containing protein [Escherichia coli]CTV28286.1 L-shaped tail fiber protein [Escherichia coli]CTW35405.1 L-shaped tail fiber protein [Escherichia coli]